MLAHNLASHRNLRAVVGSVVLAVAALVAGPSAQAQSSPQPLVFAAQAQTIQQQLNGLKTQVAALQSANATLQHQVGTLQSQLATVQSSHVLLSTD